MMKTTIRAFRKDPAEPGAWIAELACGHTQHVRHDPLMSPREWVLTGEGRARFVGKPLECPLCDGAPTPS